MEFPFDVGVGGAQCFDVTWNSTPPLSLLYGEHLELARPAGMSEK